MGTVVEHDQVGVVETAESRAGIGAEEAGEFLTGESKRITVPDFPLPGRSTVLVWQESLQNFAIESAGP